MSRLLPVRKPGEPGMSYSYLQHQTSFIMQIRVNHSPIMHCSGNKGVGIVRKRAERPFAKLSGARRDEGLRSFKSKLPESACLCHLGPRWEATQCSLLASAPRALPRLTPPFTPSPSFFFLTDSYTLCPLRTWLTIRGCIINAVLFPKGKKKTKFPFL